MATQHTAYQTRSLTYTVPSATTAGITYTVTVDPSTGLMECACKGASYGHDCWHKKAIRAGVVKPRVRIRPLEVR